MILKCASVSIMLALFSINLQAKELNPKLAGRYLKDNSSMRLSTFSPGSDAGFQVLLRGNKLGLRDLQNKINYRINLNQNEEQVLPKEFTQRLNSKPNSRSLGSLLDRATVENVRVKSSGEGLDLDLNYYIKYSSPFGQLNTKATVGFSVEFVAKCAGSYNDNYEYIEGAIDCLRINRTSHQISEFNSSLGGIGDQVLGMTFDLLVRLVGGGLFLNDREIYRVKQ